MKAWVQLLGLVCPIVKSQWGLEKPANRIDTVDRAFNLHSLFIGSIEEGNTA